MVETRRASQRTARQLEGAVGYPFFAGLRSQFVNNLVKIVFAARDGGFAQTNPAA